MPAGQAEAVQRLQEKFRARAGEQQLESPVGQCGAGQGQAGEQQGAPLAQQRQQGDQQQAGAQLHGEVAEPGQACHPLIQRRRASALRQLQQRPVEGGEMLPAGEQGEQQRCAQRRGQRCRRAPLAQAGLAGQGEQREQAAGQHPGLPPEARRQRQAQGGAGRPARQQVGHRPASRRHQADRGEARQRHVEHAGDGRQHRSQRADETAEQQADHPVALEVELGLGQPFRMATQQRQAADVLVAAAADGVGQRIAEQGTGITEQQGLPQRQRAAAGQGGDGEQQHGARHHDANDGQTLAAGDQQDGQAQPLGMGAEPGGQGVEPGTHGACAPASSSR